MHASDSLLPTRMHRSFWPWHLSQDCRFFAATAGLEVGGIAWDRQIPRVIMKDKKEIRKEWLYEAADECVDKGSGGEYAVLYTSHLIIVAAALELGGL